MLIGATELAVSEKINIGQHSQTGCFSLVGNPGSATVTIQQPAVDKTFDQLNENDDSDWMDVVYDSTTQQLSANNTKLAVPYRGAFRLVKAASAGYSFGVKFE